VIVPINSRSILGYHSLFIFIFQDYALIII